MPSVRLLLLRRPPIAALLLALALAMRLLVPAGYMPVARDGAVRLDLCPGTAPAAAATAHMDGMHHGGETDPPTKAEQPCAYAALGVPALGGGHGAFVAAALAFALPLATRAAPRALNLAAARLRPPLRAPPLAA